MIKIYGKEYEQYEMKSQTPSYSFTQAHFPKTIISSGALRILPELLCVVKHVDSGTSCRSWTPAERILSGLLLNLPQAQFSLLHGGDSNRIYTVGSF